MSCIHLFCFNPYPVAKVLPFSRFYTEGASFLKKTTVIHGIVAKKMPLFCKNKGIVSVRKGMFLEKMGIFLENIPKSSENMGKLKLKIPMFSLNLPFGSVFTGMKTLPKGIFSEKKGMFLENMGVFLATLIRLLPIGYCPIDATRNAQSTQHTTPYKSAQFSTISLNSL